MKGWLTKAQWLYLVIALLLVLWYGLSEARGWAGGGTARRPLNRSQLKQRDLGYRNHIFWFYGFRGK